MFNHYAGAVGVCDSEQYKQTRDDREICELTTNSETNCSKFPYKRRLPPESQLLLSTVHM